MPPQAPRTIDEARARGLTVVQNTDGTWTATQPTPGRPQETDGGPTQSPGSLPAGALLPTDGLPASRSGPPQTVSQAREQGLSVRRTPGGGWTASDMKDETQSRTNEYLREKLDEPRRAVVESFSAEGPLAFFNRGINLTASAGMGTEWLDRVSRAMDISIPEREPEGFAERMSQTAGMAYGVIPLVAGGAGQLATRGAQMLGGRYLTTIGRTLREPFIRTPWQAGAVEAASGAGAGAGREIAGPEYGPIGEILVGGAAGVGTAAYAAVHPIANIRRIFQFAQRNVSRGITRLSETLAPFRPEAAKAGAAIQLQQRSADPFSAAERVGTPSEYGLTPAQQTGEVNQLALERSIANRSSASSERYQEQLRNSEESLRRALQELGETGKLEGSIAAARSRADDEIRRLGAGVSEEEASRIYHRELMESLDAAKTTESELWDIPNVRLTTSNLRSTYQRLSKDLPAAQRKDMPQEANELLTRSEPPSDSLILGPSGETLLTGSPGPSRVFAESEPLSEIHGFASKMREIARQASAAGDHNRARLANELGDAAWSDLMNSADVPSSVASQLQAARVYTRALNEAFRQGEVGVILGRAPVGGARVQPTEALEVALGKQGNAQAGVTSDELTAAIGFGGRDPSVGSAAVEDYLRQRFFSSSTSPDGTYAANGARRFMENNVALLRRHPALRDQMDQAAQEMASAERLGTLRTTVSRAMQSNTPLDDLTRASTAREGSASSVEEVAATRAAVVEFALHPSGAVNEAGHRVASGTRLLGFLNQPKTKRVFEKFFSKTDVQKLETIANELANVQRASGPLAPTIPGEAVPLPAGIARIQGTLKFWAGVVGARSGARLGKGGAQLKIASFGSSAAAKGVAQYLNQHIDEVIVDSMSNRPLFQALLLKSDAPAQETESALRVLREWVKQARQEIPSALNRMLVTTAIGTEAAMMPDRDQRRMPSRPVSSRGDRPGTPEATGTMADILPVGGMSRRDLIQRGNMITGHPLTWR
jgi:hypothetical protein